MVLCGAIFDNPRLCGSVMALEEVTSLRVGPAPGWSSLAAGAAMTEGGSAPCQLSPSLGRGVVSESCEKALRVAGMSGSIPSDPVAAMVEHADVEDLEEVQMVAYTGKNVVHGTRAHDEALLDRANITKLAPVQESAASIVGSKYSQSVTVGRSECMWLDAQGDASQKPGLKIKHQSTKNNKKQV